MNIRTYLKYLSYLARHKWFVFIECVKFGMPIRGLFHDLSKFLPDEFFPYAHHFAGGIKRGRDETGDPAFDYAWFLHQKRNSHHWQYHCFANDAGSENPIIVFEMPLSLRKEMIADWRGAGRAQGTPDTLAWYRKNRQKIVLAPATRQWIEREIGFTV